MTDTVSIPLRARYGNVRGYALIDAADADFVNQWRWHLKDGRYPARGITDANGRCQSVFLHRELLGLPVVRGDGPEGDHIDRDTLNNRRENLRIAPKQGNQQNIAPRGATSRFRGVSRIAASQRWQAKVVVDRKVVFLAIYKTEEEAAWAAYDARKIHHPFTVEEPPLVPRITEPTTSLRPHQRGAATRIGISTVEYAAHIEAGELRCSACKSWKDVDAFNKRTAGQHHRQGECRQCSSARLRQRNCGGDLDLGVLLEPVS